MKVDISEIVKVDGGSLNIEINESLDELDTVVDDFEFHQPVDFKGRLTNVSGVLKLDGRLKTDYDAECYRCLKKLKMHMDIEIKEDFVDSSTNTDSETYTYEGKYIDIDRVLKDNIVLNLPMKQVCTSECKGLCPKCGADLNEKTCDCEEENINPQMEILKNFFNN